MDSATNADDSAVYLEAKDLASRLVAAVVPVLAVDSIRYLAENPKPGPLSPLSPFLEIRGRLTLPPERAFAMVAERFRKLGHTPMFRKEGADDLILAVRGEFGTKPGKPWLAIGLFALTFLSVMSVGVSEDTGNLLLTLLSGWPFAISMLSILLAHEFGHYLVSRRLGTPVSLPYFIPMPLSILGTMGAFIRMKGPPRDRRSLFAIAISGPLAGLVVAIPILILGLHLSSVGSIPVGQPSIQEGNSLLYVFLKLLLFGRFLPAGGEDVLLHPVAMAGWAGLLVTGLNLIPAGQLDGGHIAYAILGEKARWLTRAIVVVLVALGFLWSSWWIWAALVYFFGRFQTVLMDEITVLRPIERSLAAVAMLIFVLVFVPIPLIIH